MKAPAGFAHQENAMGKKRKNRRKKLKRTVLDPGFPCPAVCSHRDIVAPEIPKMPEEEMAVDSVVFGLAECNQV